MSTCAEEMLCTSPYPLRIVELLYRFQPAEQQEVPMRLPHLSFLVFCLLFLCNCGGTVPLPASVTTTPLSERSWIEACVSAGAAHHAIIQVNKAPRFDLKSLTLIEQRAVFRLLPKSDAVPVSESKNAIQHLRSKGLIGRIVGHLLLKHPDPLVKTLAASKSVVAHIQDWIPSFKEWQDTPGGLNLISNDFIVVLDKDKKAVPSFYNLPKNGVYPDDIIPAEPLKPPDKGRYTPAELSKTLLDLPCPDEEAAIFQGMLEGELSFVPIHLELINAQGKGLGCIPIQ